MLKKLINRLLNNVSLPVINSTVIPRRPLTTESTAVLRETLEKAVNEMLKTSCPCHYPRFRFLTSFNHQNYNSGAVFCADTNYLIAIATNEKLNYLEQMGQVSGVSLGDYGNDLLYRCRKCSTLYRKVANQYSISFEFEYLIVEDAKFSDDVGCSVSFPVILYQGLFGFNDANIVICAVDFKLSNQQALLRYLTCE